MATIFRTWSYQYQWLYDGISRLAALSVGGEKRFRHLALQGLQINSDTEVLDLCCGGGQTTQFLVQFSRRVTGLDASPIALQRAAGNVPQAKYVEGLAEKMPLADNRFDLVDFHKPTNWLFWPPLGLFMWLFETDTAWQLLETDLVEQLESVGFKVCHHNLYAGGSLQVIQANK